MTNWTEVEQIVQREEGAGRIGIAVVGPNGERWSHRADEQFRAASCVKIPLMIAIYRRIDAGELSLDVLGTLNLDRIHTLSNDDKTFGSGILLHMHEGLEVTLNDLIFLMMSISDNTATNILIDMAGMDTVNEIMQELGMPQSTLARKMRGVPAEPDEPENIATANDYVNVLQTLFDSSAASEESCAGMLKMLTLQSNLRRIARYLPTDERIVWGSKTGSLTGVCNDVGFIETPQGRMLIAVFLENIGDAHHGEQVIGDLALAAARATGVLPL